jgi:hypothetical protein
MNILIACNIDVVVPAHGWLGLVNNDRNACGMDHVDYSIAHFCVDGAVYDHIRPQCNERLDVGDLRRRIPGRI